MFTRTNHRAPLVVLLAVAVAIGVCLITTSVYAYSLGSVTPSSLSVGSSTDQTQLALAYGRLQNPVPSANSICFYSASYQTVTQCDTPQGGIYATGFSVRAGATGGNVRLSVFRPDGGTTTRDDSGSVVEQSSSQTVMADHTSSFTTNIPVQAGDGFALSTVGTGPELSYANTYYEPCVVADVVYDYEGPWTGTPSDCGAEPGIYQVGTLGGLPSSGDHVSFSSFTDDHSLNLSVNLYVDVDGDGLAGDNDPDNDGDGLLDSADNCVYKANADQSDYNRDGRGTVCDSRETDYDGDGKRYFEDNCPSIANADQADVDRDGRGDVCDYPQTTTTTTPRTYTTLPVPTPARVKVSIRGYDRRFPVSNKTTALSFKVKASLAPTRFYLTSTRLRVKRRDSQNKSLLTCKTKLITKARAERNWNTCTLSTYTRRVVRSLKKGESLRLKLHLKGRYKSSTGATSSDTDQVFISLVKK